LLQKTTVFCDSTFLSHHHTFGLHGGGGVIDCAWRQGYKVCVIMAPCER
jgi:hypothetical protein